MTTGEQIESMQDKETATGIQAATATPEAVAEWMKRRRPDLMFNLWDAKRTGSAGREQLGEALSW